MSGTQQRHPNTAGRTLAAQHAHVNPNDQVLLAMTKGVSLNNLGLELFNNGDYVHALDAFNKAIAIKTDAYGYRSIHVCITLSGVCDCHLKLGDLETAERETQTYIDIASELGSKQQLKIAREIMKEIQAAKGARTKKLSKDEKGKMKTTEKHVLTSTSAAGQPTESMCISVEEPTVRCFNPTCPDTPQITANSSLMKCSICQFAKYCSKACQKLDWKSHKITCKTSNSQESEDFREIEFHVSSKMLEPHSTWASRAPDEFIRVFPHKFPKKDYDILLESCRGNGAGQTEILKIINPLVEYHIGQVQMRYPTGVPCGFCRRHGKWKMQSHLAFYLNAVSPHIVCILNPFCSPACHADNEDTYNEVMTAKRGPN